MVMCGVQIDEFMQNCIVSEKKTNLNKMLYKVH
jgi:hypothetical protein